jgi:hypothetical protein
MRGAHEQQICRFFAWMYLVAVLSSLFISPAAAQNKALRNAEPHDLRIGAAWGKERHGALAAFSAWADTSPTSEPESLARGVALAKQRRNLLAQLITSDPAQALAAAIPATVRKRLPAEVAEQLETFVSGIGDLS